MRKFRFRLDTVLDLRKKREDEALRLLAAAQRAFQAEVARKNGILGELADALERRENLGAKATSVHAFQLEQNFIQGCKQRVIQADQAISRTNRGVEKALRAYLTARRQTRMIETLREKAFAEFKKELNKKEAKELDDLTIMRLRLKEESA